MAWRSAVSIVSKREEAVEDRRPLRGEFQQAEVWSCGAVKGAPQDCRVETHPSRGAAASVLLRASHVRAEFVLVWQRLIGVDLDEMLAQGIQVCAARCSLGPPIKLRSRDAP
jgi:hypothetical protein